MILWDAPQAVELSQGIERYLRRYALGWPITILTDANRAEALLRSGLASVLVVRTSSAADSRRINAPTVVYCDSKPPPRPEDLQVWFDDAAVGRAAAQHLVQRGYRSFACQSSLLGAGAQPYRVQREEAFVHELARLGYSCMTRRSMPQEQQSLDVHLAWLLALPRGTGVFCHEDHGARLLLAELSNLGRKDVGVVGAGDFDFSDGIGMSSVRLSWVLLGHELARLLHCHLSGSGSRTATAPPIGVAARASTSTITGASWLAKTEAWMRKCTNRLPDVAGLARHLGVSRSTLNRRFQSELGCPAKEYLRERRLLEVREALLRNEAASIETLARRFGWCDGSHLIRDFRRTYGLTPGTLQTALAPRSTTP